MLFSYFLIHKSVSNRSKNVRTKTWQPKLIAMRFLSFRISRFRFWNLNIYFRLDCLFKLLIFIWIWKNHIWFLFWFRNQFLLLNCLSYFTLCLQFLFWLHLRLHLLLLLRSHRFLRLSFLLMHLLRNLRIRPIPSFMRRSRRSRNLRRGWPLLG